jgi:hypothetical protein
MFYKDKSAYGTGGLTQNSTGGSMGFQNSSSIPGYGIEFDTWQNWQFTDEVSRHVALIQNDVSNHLAWVSNSAVGDDAWHNVLVQFRSGVIVVSIDGQSVLTASLRDVDQVTDLTNYTYTGVGFAAGTGDLTDNHIVDDFVLTVQAPAATPTTTPTATPTTTPTATPTATPMSTATSTPTATPTNTLTSTPTNRPTSTPTAVPSSTPSPAPSGTAIVGMPAGGGTAPTSAVGATNLITP